MAIHPEQSEHRELSLFSGIGGGSVGSKILGFRTVCYVEKNPFCRSVLEARIDDGILDDAPIWDNVRTFETDPWTGKVDIVTAGFPCQPFSQAGDKKAENDERNLWPDTISIIRSLEPNAVLLENVPNILNFEYIGEICGDLASIGYHCIWGIIPARAIGAPHQRERFWLLAYSDGARPKNSTFPPSQFQRDHLPGWIMRERDQREIDGVLNPEFVELLMGLPIGWTASARSVTPNGHSRWLSRSECLVKDSSQ